MTVRSWRWWAALVAALVLVANCSGGDGGGGSDRPDLDDTTTSEGGSRADGSQVPISAGEVGIDPEVRIGRLDNGLTYYVRRNDAPGSQLQLRLVVKAGSVHEDEPLSGIAHFTEHMMFNGTEAFPKNTLNDVLRSFGGDFGADLNAYTSHDETVYQLSLPRVDDDAVEVAFDVLDEWAERALITEDDTVEERGVVREEFRLRAESVDGVIFESFDRIYTDGSPYADREPIGREEAIVATTADQLRSFYDRWYRPDRMAVIAVGDVDPDRLEDEIRDRFADNEDRGDGAAPPDLAAPLLDAPYTEVLTHPDGPEPFVSLDYSLPLRASGTVAGERLLLLDEVVAALIQQHLDEGTARGTIPVVRPSVGNFDYTRARRFLGFNFVADDEAAGLTVVVAELRGLAERGFGDRQLERVVQEFQAAVDQMLDSVETRQDADYAGDYVEHFLGGFAIDSAEDAHQRLSEALAGFDVATVSRHFADVMAQNAPLVIVVGSDPAELPTVEALDQALLEAETAEVAARADGGERALPDAPDPVDEIERNTIPGDRGLELVFANGARVLLQNSTIAAGQVDLLAESSGGWSLLGEGDGPYAGLAAQAVGLSGVGELDSVDLDEVLAGRVVGVTPFIDQTQEGFFGNSSVDDVEQLFQLLHLRIVSPRVDTGPFAEVLENARGQLRASETSPEFASLVALLDAAYGGDPWQELLARPPRLDEFSATEALDLYRARLGRVDDLNIAVVGDLDPEDLVDLARRYIGTLPAGPTDTWVDRAPAPPAGVVTREIGAGTNDSGAGFDLLLVTDGVLTESQQLALPILENVINDAFIEQLREALGATYTGGQAFLEIETAPDELVTLFLRVSGDPGRIDEMHRLVLDTLDDLAANGPSSTQFDQAKAVVMSDLDFISNFTLMEDLLAWAELGDDAIDLAEQYGGTLDLDRGDVADLAAVVLDTGRRVEVFRRP